MILEDLQQAEEGIPGTAEGSLAYSVFTPIAADPLTHAGARAAHFLKLALENLQHHDPQTSSSARAREVHMDIHAATLCLADLQRMLERGTKLPKPAHPGPTRPEGDSAALLQYPPGIFTRGNPAGSPPQHATSNQCCQEHRPSGRGNGPEMEVSSLMQQTARVHGPPAPEETPPPATPPFLPQPSAPPATSPANTVLLDWARRADRATHGMLMSCFHEVDPHTVGVPDLPPHSPGRELSIAEETVGIIHYELTLALAWHGTDQSNALTSVQSVAERRTRAVRSLRMVLTDIRHLIRNLQQAIAWAAPPCRQPEPFHGPTPLEESTATTSPDLTNQQPDLTSQSLARSSAAPLILSPGAQESHRTGPAQLTPLREPDSTSSPETVPVNTDSFPSATGDDTFVMQRDHTPCRSP